MNPKKKKPLPPRKLTPAQEAELGALIDPIIDRHCKALREEVDAVKMEFLRKLVRKVWIETERC